MDSKNLERQLKIKDIYEKLIYTEPSKSNSSKCKDWISRDWLQQWLQSDSDNKVPKIDNSAALCPHAKWVWNLVTSWNAGCLDGSRFMFTFFWRRLDCCSARRTWSVLIQVSVHVHSAVGCGICHFFPYTNAFYVAVRCLTVFNSTHTEGVSFCIRAEKVVSFLFLAVQADKLYESFGTHGGPRLT